jgi:hypothetical protein
LWPRSDESFVPVPEPPNFIHVNPGVPLALRTGGWVHFLNIQFSNPASRIAPMPRGFFNGVGLGLKLDDVLSLDEPPMSIGAETAQRGGN